MHREGNSNLVDGEGRGIRTWMKGKCYTTHIVLLTTNLSLNINSFCVDENKINLNYEQSELHKFEFMLIIGRVVHGGFQRK